MLKNSIEIHFHVAYIMIRSCSRHLKNPASLICAQNYPVSLLVRTVRGE